jgi:hypothetical protein
MAEHTITLNELEEKGLELHKAKTGIQSSVEALESFLKPRLSSFVKDAVIDIERKAINTSESAGNLNEIINKLG